MKINLDTPIVNRAGMRMNEGTAESPGKEATIGSLIFQIIDTPIAADMQAGLDRRIAAARIGRCVTAAKGDVELDSSEVSLLLDRAAAQPIPSVVFEQLVEALDPARWKV